MPGSGIYSLLCEGILNIYESEESTMCVALPGKVIEVKDGQATVDFSGNQVQAFIGLVDVQVGDYVLVHAGCVIQKMKQQEAEEIIDLMSGIAE